MVQPAKFLHTSALAAFRDGDDRSAVAGFAYRKGIQTVFPEPWHFSDELYRLGNKPLAVVGSIRIHIPAGSSSPGVPIPAACGYDCHAAGGARLHRVLLLYVQGESVP